MFRSVISALFPQVPFEAFMAKAKQCKDNLQFQTVFVKPFLEDMLKKHSDGLDANLTDIDDRLLPHTFISNHRDIVLDSALLSVLMLNNGFRNTVEIAIGDNLLIYPWIKTLVRIDKSFLVQRAANMRQKLISSARLGRYINFAVACKHENVWIAQREGRSKDSSDLTQEAILKMMAMGGEGTIVERLKAINIVPTCISYEYDPCDYLKAQEFQQKRDIADFKKSPGDDLVNMQTGMIGFKGHIHYDFAPTLNAWLDALPADTPKNDIFRLAASEIDRNIHLRYRLYASNYVAADLLLGKEDYAARYTADEKAHFQHYLEGQLAKIQLPRPDIPFLRERILTMYANPLFSKAAASR
jgi:hypothetical protein